MTMFVSGKNCGSLTMSPDEADWFYLALERGCKAVSPPGLKPLEFVGSGSHRPNELIPPLPETNSKPKWYGFHKH